jgi:hypothetical protein
MIPMTGKAMQELSTAGRGHLMYLMRCSNEHLISVWPILKVLQTWATGDLS